jgi:hypothetical protein
MFWDFLSQTPESLHQVTILFSDRGGRNAHKPRSCTLSACEAPKCALVLADA